MESYHPFEPKDFISNMPDDVVTNIMDRLPLQHAARTGILSRKWRFKWNMISQLVLDENFFEYLLKTEHKHNYGRIISRLLLHLKGAITKFVLNIDMTIKLDDEDINHCILFLSRNGIKDLTLEIWNGEVLNLPTHLFSCLDLKHLKLNNCNFDPPPGFNGFPKLLSLEIIGANYSSNKLWKCLSLCPSLEILKIQSELLQILFTNFLSQGKVKLVEIAKLTNLKILSLLLCEFGNAKIINSNIIFELVGLLPKLQELYLDFLMCKFTEDGANKRSLATLPCLKALTLTSIKLSNNVMLSCVFEMIRCFPNLQTLEITAFGRVDDVAPTICFPEVEYNTNAPLQLQSVVFRDLKGSANEFCLIKYLLARYPFLKKVVIHPRESLLLGEKLFVRKLLKLHRASPVAEIDLY